MNLKSKQTYLSFLTILATFTFTLLQFSCKAQIETDSKRTKSTYAPQTPCLISTADMNDPRRNWTKETSIDTIITFNSDTYEERLTIKKTEYLVTVDTIIILDGDTFEETMSIVKTYKSVPDDPKKSKN